MATRVVVENGEKEKPTKGKGIEKLFDFLGEVLALITVIVYAVLIINANWSFIPADHIIYTIFVAVKTYGLLALLTIVGLEAVVKRNFVIKIVFLLLIAVVIVFQFFPGTWDSITGAIGGGGF
ncbi:MAG: hypothetical protein EOM87_00445 [Clostridia bacterium]|nr:hypothetical protein [Clostridia bacterium]